MQLLSLEQNNSSFKQTVPDPAEGPGRRGPSYFWTKPRTEGPKKLGGKTTPLI